MRMSQQHVPSHRWRQECQCSCFSPSVLLLCKLSGDCFCRHALRKRLYKVSWHAAVGKQDMSVHLLWCSQSTCNWYERIKIKAATSSHLAPPSLSTPYLHLSEAASVVNFRVAMVYFEKGVEPAFCHAAGKTRDKKDQEKTSVYPGTFQRALWSWECHGC